MTTICMKKPNENVTFLCMSKKMGRILTKLQQSMADYMTQGLLERIFEYECIHNNTMVM